MDSDIIIVGGGPAGASAAARLARDGIRVLLLEEKRMPRHKVCGEFITPESLPVLERLGVIEEIQKADAQPITRLTLIASNGITVETSMEEMSNVNRSALSLSRARLDHILFDNAARSGAICLEAMAVKRFLFDNGAPCGVEAMSLDDGKTVEFKARLIVDASGRNSRLTLSRRERTVGKRGARLYALKSHLRAVEGIEDQVELYFFPEGYGGLSRIEDGLVNLCFIVTERALTDAGGDPANTLQRTFMNHPTARERLAQARVEGRWMSAGPLAFGTRRLAQDGALIIGDASGMIDPFTGTGIQIALRAGELAAQSIIEAFQSSNGDLFDSALMSYRALYDQEFGRRMKMAGLLRRAALSPRPANLLARLLARAPRIARKILRSTRA